MTTYENDRGTRFYVGFTFGYRTWKNMWCIARLRSNRKVTEYLKREYDNAESAQTALDEMAKKKGWKNVEAIENETHAR